LAGLRRDTEADDADAFLIPSAPFSTSPPAKRSKLGTKELAQIYFNAFQARGNEQPARTFGRTKETCISSLQNYVSQLLNFPSTILSTSLAKSAFIRAKRKEKHIISKVFGEGKRKFMLFHQVVAYKKRSLK